MYSDVDGHFGILVTLLIATSVGALVGGGLNLGKQLVTNKFDFANVNWWSVGASALAGAATGLAYGLGGVAGSIVKGSLATIGHLSVYQSVGVLTSAALATNFAAGMGVYALHEAGNEKTTFNLGMMLSGGIGQMLKGGLSFAMGGMMSGSGLWKIGKGVKNPYSPISRAISNKFSTFIPNLIIDEIFDNF